MSVRLSGLPGIAWIALRRALSLFLERPACTSSGSAMTAGAAAEVFLKLHTVLELEVPIQHARRRGHRTHCRDKLRYAKRRPPARRRRRVSCLARQRGPWSLFSGAAAKKSKLQAEVASSPRNYRLLLCCILSADDLTPEIAVALGNTACDKTAIFRAKRGSGTEFGRMKRRIT